MMKTGVIAGVTCLFGYFGTALLLGRAIGWNADAAFGVFLSASCMFYVWFTGRVRRNAR